MNKSAIVTLLEKYKQHKSADNTAEQLFYENIDLLINFDSRTQNLSAPDILPQSVIKDLFSIVRQYLQQKNSFQTELYALFPFELKISDLVQGIVKDNRAYVEKAIHEKPELLLQQINLEIEHPFTGQKLKVENIFVFCVSQRQFKMIELFFPFLKFLIKMDQHKNSVASVLKQSLLELNRKYCDHQEVLNQLVKLFSTEIDFTYYSLLFRPLGPKIETCMEQIYQKLLPDYQKEKVEERRVLSAQDSFDLHSFLIDTFNAYEKNFPSNFININRSDDIYLKNNKAYAFSIRVIGILQLFLPAESAKLFWNGFSSEINSGYIWKENDPYLLGSPHHAYYAAKGDSVLRNRKGNGFEFVWNIQGDKKNNWRYSSDSYPSFQYYYRAEMTKLFESLKSLLLCLPKEFLAIENTVAPLNDALHSLYTAEAITGNKDLLHCIIEAKHHNLSNLSKIIDNISSFSEYSRACLNNMPIIQLVKELKNYREYGYKFWEGWGRTHSEFIKNILDAAELTSFEMVQEKFRIYVAEKNIINTEGDFARICRFLDVQLRGDKTPEPLKLSSQSQ